MPIPEDTAAAARPAENTQGAGAGCTAVTFATVSDACAMEARAREFGLPGRLAPIPSCLSAGCGYAWVAPEGDRAALEEALARHAVAHEGVFDIPGPCG